MTRILFLQAVLFKSAKQLICHIDMHKVANIKRMISFVISKKSMIKNWYWSFSYTTPGSLFRKSIDRDVIGVF